jgi:tRNA pseudouridine13 synthase
VTVFEEMAALPCAHGGPAGSAQLRAAPEDFLVQEWLGWEPDGVGDHLLLTVRKRGANTLWVAKQLARLAKLDPRDVGFAGLKDRDAVAEQSFTVPARSAIGESWAGVAGEGFEVVAAVRHRRKLKRGALKGNDFTITLRAFSGEPSALEQRLHGSVASRCPRHAPRSSMPSSRGG